MPSDTLRSLTRKIGTKSFDAIWHKIADGKIIEALPEGSFAIDDKNYFVNFSGDSKLQPIIRNINGRDELLVKIPSGNQKLTYTIIW